MSEHVVYVLVLSCTHFLCMIWGETIYVVVANKSPVYGFHRVRLLHFSLSVSVNAHKMSVFYVSTMNSKT